MPCLPFFLKEFFLFYINTAIGIILIITSLAINYVVFYKWYPIESFKINKWWTMKENYESFLIMTFLEEKKLKEVLINYYGSIEFSKKVLTASLNQLRRRTRYLVSNFIPYTKFETWSCGSLEMALTTILCRIESLLYLNIEGGDK